MPELPEVETIATQLKARIVGAKIIETKVLDTKKIKLKLSKLKDKNIIDIFRLSKNILIKIQTGDKEKFLYLSFHLRMTGQLIWQPKKSIIDDLNRKHLRLLIITNKGSLCFYDVRRFGVVELSNDLSKFKSGLEPLSKEFNYESFAKLFRKSKQNIKQFLLRQDKIAGIGNIYASEILFNAKINPLREVDTLQEDELRRIFKSIKLILNKAVKHGGTSFSDYQDSFGKTGSHQKYLKVYSKSGQICPRCKIGTITRMVQQQRSTFYCPNCQS